jgi:hypothetical protein
MAGVVLAGTPYQAFRSIWVRRSSPQNVVYRVGQFRITREDLSRVVNLERAVSGGQNQRLEVTPDRPLGG